MISVPLTFSTTTKMPSTIAQIPNRETSGMLKIADSRAILVIVHGTTPLPRCKEEKFKLRLSSQPHTKRWKKERPSTGI